MLLVPEEEKENLYQVPTSGGRPTLLVAPPTGGYTSLVIPEKAARTHLIAGYGSSISPLEIVRLDTLVQTYQPYELQYDVSSND